ncbi:MAG: GNAT family N-acetyltransferase [Candidatus Eisenbacteria sp.]|nr:GNAT family N-acetyltransferase [Candidatus Eisenbacteria bacterium]
MLHTRMTIRSVKWTEAEGDIRRIRETVFIKEQNVPEELEWDGLDPDCAHVLAYDEDGEAVGTGRLRADGHIERMAVLEEWRGRGIGDRLLHKLLDLAREKGFSRVTLWAQTHAIPFYERHGFQAVGGEFMDAGIPHREMQVSLDNPG